MWKSSRSLIWCGTRSSSRVGAEIGRLPDLVGKSGRSRMRCQKIGLRLHFGELVLGGDIGPQPDAVYKLARGQALRRNCAPARLGAEIGPRSDLVPKFGRGQNGCGYQSASRYVAEIWPLPDLVRNNKVSCWIWCGNFPQPCSLQKSVSAGFGVEIIQRFCAAVKRFQRSELVRNPDRGQIWCENRSADRFHAKSGCAQIWCGN